MLRNKISRLNAIRLPMPWHKPRIKTAAEGADTVVLLHGLWRSVWAMEPLANLLHTEGYHTVNIAYPSFTKSMDHIIAMVEAEIQTHLQKGKVHLVTHSLGGIVAREILGKLSAENIGRLVMLAPPNQGSEIIDWLSNVPLLHRTMGPAGMQLGSGKITAPHLPKHIDAAVIMGRRSIIPFFRKMLDADNDGIVSVERGKVEGMNEFHIVDADHTFIATEPEVMQKILGFLKRGSAY